MEKEMNWSVRGRRRIMEKKIRLGEDLIEGVKL